MRDTRSAGTIALEPEPTAPITDLRSYFENSARLTAKLPYTQVEAVAIQLELAYNDGRAVFLFGNGGSAALASHFACDLGKGTVVPEKDQKRLRVLSLTDNVPLLTAWANDTSYEMVFAEQLRNFAQPGDIAFAISGSGSSPNILRGLETARGAGAITIGLTGFNGGKMRELCDICMIIPSDNMQTIEDFHLSIAHALFTVLRHRIVNTQRSAAAVHDHEQCPFPVGGRGAGQRRLELLDRGR